MRKTANIGFALLLLIAALAALGCITVETPDVPAMVAAELTRAAPTPTTASEPAATLVTPTDTPLPQPTATPTVAELVAKFRPSIAQIITPDGTGSGFVYDPSGLVATNAHVVENRRWVTVVLGGREYQGGVLNRNEDADLAVVQVIAGRNFAILLGSAGRVTLGEDVMALGFPLSSQLGDDLTVTRGIVSARRQFDGYEYFQTDAALNPGNSGGPLLNRNGEVIGVITFGIRDAEGIAFALSVDELNSRLGALSRVPPTTTPPPPRTGTEVFQQVSAGWYHTCGVATNGRVTCWGIKERYGTGSPPTGVFQEVSVGLGHICGVRTNGQIVCWGDNEYGQAAPPMGMFAQVSAGHNHTCGIRTNSQIVCWGNNGYGQSTPPTGMFAQVSAGHNHTCGVMTNGQIVCWGGDEYREAWRWPWTGAFTEVSAGSIGTCGLYEDSYFDCWTTGSHVYGEPSFKQVSIRYYHLCGVNFNGHIICWGNNASETHHATPPEGIFQQVSSGNYHTCGLKTNGRVVCWGHDEYGQATPP